MTDIMWNILSSKDKVHLNSPSSDVREAMDFGFSYMESADHMVHYVIANGPVMKRILMGVDDAVISPNGDSIGKLWTAQLMVSGKLKNNEIIFSNNTYNTIINLHPKEQSYGSL